MDSLRCNAKDFMLIGKIAVAKSSITVITDSNSTSMYPGLQIDKPKQVPAPKSKKAFSSQNPPYWFIKSVHDHGEKRSRQNDNIS